MDVAEVAGRGEVGGEAQASGVQGLAEHLGQARARRTGPRPRGECLDLGAVGVDAEDVVSEHRHADGVGGAEVPRAEHGQARRRDVVSMIVLLAGRLSGVRCTGCC